MIGMIGFVLGIHLDFDFTVIGISSSITISHLQIN